MELTARVLVNVQSDEQECEVTLLPPPEGSSTSGLDVMSLIEFLQEKRIIFGVDDNAIMENVLLANQTGQKISFIAARAIPPIPGGKGTMEIMLSFPLEERKKMLTSEKITLSGAKVKNGQLLAKVNNEQLAGAPGTSVMGSPISAPSGKPVHLIAGKNIKIETHDKTMQYFSTADGIAYLENNELIYIKTFSDGFFETQISLDKQTLYLTIIPPTNGGRFVDSKEIIEFLQNEKIVLSEDKKVEIRKLIYHVSSGESDVERFELLRGTPPVNGENGKIDFAVEVNPLRVLYGKNERINFYNILQINEVKKGTLLAYKVLPTKGLRDGVDIFGQVIPAMDGKEAPTLQAGKNVKLSEDKLEYYSEIDGQIKWDHNQIWVSPTYIVEGDVNFSTGNISFNGDVIIKGNVLDNFQVRADDNIIVYNSIQSANIFAGRDLIVKNGILNKKRSSIIVQGDLRCRFMENSNAEVSGSVFIEEYLLNSELTCKNIVEISDKGKGQVLGGEILAVKGVKTKSIGNENEVLTKVYVGRTIFYKRQLETIEKGIEELKKKTNQLITTLEELLKNKENEKYKETLKNKVILNYNLEQLIKKKILTIGELEKKSLCFIRIAGDIYPNTELVLNDKKVINKKMDSFRLYYYNIKNDNIFISNYSKKN